MKINVFFEALKDMRATFERVEADTGVDMGNFAASFVACDEAGLKEFLHNAPVIAQLLREPFLAGAGISNTSANNSCHFARSLLVLAAAIDSTKAWRWVQAHSKQMPLKEMAAWTLETNPVATAVQSHSLNVLELLYKEHGKKLFTTELFGGMTVFSHAIGHDKKRSTLWMLNKDPSLMNRSIRLSSAPGSEPRYMSVLEYAGSACTANSTLPDALRSLKSSIEARSALKEIRGTALHAVR